MNKEIKKIWTDALLSGEYTQGKHRLHSREAETYCCLGVLCDLAVKHGVTEMREVYGDFQYGTGSNEYDWSDKVLPGSVTEWAGLEDDNPDVINPQDGTGSCLAELNDVGFTFEQIAKIIEEEL